MVEYTIETTSWDNVRLFWEKWRNYDISVKTYGLNIKNKVYINTSVFIPEPAWDEDKTLGFYKDGVLMGCGQIKDFSKDEFTMAGISNMCVDPAYRNNGIGTAIMDIMLQYMRLNDFDFSILYPSLYSKIIGFYEKFGYEDYEKVMILKLKKLPPEKKLDKIIQSLDRF